jgi:uncharacterized protein YggE
MRYLKMAGVTGLGVLIAACSGGQPDARGLRPDETMLSVSASGHAESRPDQAQFQAGISTWAPDAKAASEANSRKISEIVSALEQIGIPDEDIQTRALSIQRLDWGARKGQYQASNVVSVTVRNVSRAGAAVTAATSAGANILSGPDLRMANPEVAANRAYTSAYKAARSRAEAYAVAAGMKVARVLTIRDGGGSQGDRYLTAAVPVAPPPVMAEQAAVDASARLMPGQTASTVAVQVDFALAPK